MFIYGIYRCSEMGKMFNDKISYNGHSYDATRLHKPICQSAPCFGLYLEQFNDSNT